MRDPRWVVNRLRTMSAGEVTHRIRRLAGQRVERARLAAGWAPGERSRLLRSRPLFGNAGDERPPLIAEWKSCFDLDVPGLEALLGGRLPMFGEEFAVGADVDWHRDPRTGRRAPSTYGMGIDYRQPEIVGDIKVLWEIGRHQHLVPLAVAYAVTGERRFQEAVLAQVDSWIATNPYGTGIHWCSAMEVALRGIAWSMVHSLLALRDDEGLFAATKDPRALTRSIYQHGYFVARNLSRYSSANNHLIGELVGLLCLGSVFDFGDESARWRARAREELDREIHAQVYPDGVAKEQAVQYQLELLDYFVFAGCLAQFAEVPFSRAYFERLAAMLRFLEALAPVGGLLPQIGDSDEGMVNRFEPSPPDPHEREVIATVGYLLWGLETDPPCEKAFWYRRIAHPPGSSAQDVLTDATEQRPGIVSFSDGGYAVIRDQALHLVFDAGPLGYLSIAAHGHADALAFCAAWRGEWWLVDPGTYAYHGDPVHRPYFRGTAAHNTVMVEGTDQSEQGGAFMWLTHAPARITGSGPAANGFQVEGCHDGYRRLGVLHRRRLETIRPNAFVVVDEFESSAAGERRFDLNLHFHPDVRLRLEGGDCIATREGRDEDLRIRLDAAWAWETFRGSDEPLAGWYSPGLGRKEPCSTLRGTRRAAGDHSVATRFEFTPIDGVS